MAGPPALDEEELSSGDENSVEEEDDYETGGDEGEVNVGLGGLDMSDMKKKGGEEENQVMSQRGNRGKRSGEEYLSGEADTEEEEDFSSPPAKVVTPSKRRVIVSGFLQTSTQSLTSIQSRFCSSFHWHAKLSNFEIQRHA